MLFDCYPKYQNGMPGHDWDILGLTLDATNIQMIEEDILALLRRAKMQFEIKESCDFMDCWLFKPGAVILSKDDVQISNQIYDKMTTSGSWIMTVAAGFVHLFRLRILHLVLGACQKASGEAVGEQEEPETLAEWMTRKLIRRASDSRENEALYLMTQVYPDWKICGDVTEFIGK